MAHTPLESHQEQAEKMRTQLGVWGTTHLQKEAGQERLSSLGEAEGIWLGYVWQVMHKNTGI